MSDSDFPQSAHELRSTLTDDGVVTLSLQACDIRAPGDDEVVVRIEAAPINPSDLGMLFARADISQATPAVGADGPAVSAPVDATSLAGQAGRLGKAMPVGNEGAGTVVAAGSSPEARQMMGRVVGFLSGNSYAEYGTMHVRQCLVMPEGITAAEAAAPFVNPLTALGMVETMRAEGHTALLHTVGASNLGLMLNRVCIADGVGLVNIVRKPEQAAQLRSLGAEHVVDSSATSFIADLTAALRATGATIAFDAIGGGDLAGTVLSTMEKVQSEQAGEFSRYGSDTLKQVYIYGGLGRGPTLLDRDFGMSWSVGGWLLTPFLAKIGESEANRLRQRVANEITTTFASSYGMTVSLTEAVDADIVKRYGRMATGDKALITPQA